MRYALLALGIMLASPHVFAGPRQNPTSSITAQAPKAQVTPQKVEIRTEVTPDLKLGDTIDINTATVQQFEALPGVGPVLAQRLFDHREANGAYQRVDDLINVQGIGQVKLQNMRGYCVVNDDTIRTWKPMKPTNDEARRQ